MSASSLFAEAQQEAGERILRVARESASQNVAEALNLQVNDPVVEIVRIRTANETPVLLERLVFPLKFGERFLALVPGEQPVHQQLFDEGVVIDNASRTAEASTATARQAELLDISEGDPVWRLEMRAFTSQGEPVEYAENLYRGDMVKAELSSVRGASIPVKFEIAAAQE
nr:UTRA domain-containing protein [Corynebacterium sp. p3-SID1194]